MQEILGSSSIKIIIKKNRIDIIEIWSNKICRASNRYFE